MLRKLWESLYEYSTPKDLQTIHQFMDDNRDELEEEYKALNPELWNWDEPLETTEYLDWAKERSIDLMQKLYDQFLNDNM